MTQEQKKELLAVEAEQLLDVEMNEIRGGYDACGQSCKVSCSPGNSN